MEGATRDGWPEERPSPICWDPASGRPDTARGCDSPARLPMEATIIDLTCSTRRIWPAVATIRCDIDPSVKPDVVCDATATPFPDGFADELYVDPPHLVKSWKNHALDAPETTHMENQVGPKLRGTVGKVYHRFGMWPGMAPYHAFLDRGNIEWHRLLKPTGTLHYKTTDGSRSHGTTIRVADLAARLTNFAVVQDERVESHGPFARILKAKHGITVWTHYVTLRPRVGLSATPEPSRGRRGPPSSDGSGWVGLDSDVSALTVVGGKVEIVVA